MVLTAGWTGAEFAGGAVAAEKGAADYWGQLEDSGMEVIAIRDTPTPRQNTMARDCVAKNRDRLRHCGRDRVDALAGDDWFSAAQQREPRADLLDFTDQFCTEKLCPAVVGNVLVYRDQNHISDTYMATIAPEFERQLNAALQKDGLAARAGS